MAELGEDFESLDNAALAAKLEELNAGNASLSKENAALASYLHRHVSPEDADEWADDETRRGRKGKGGRKYRVTTLTLDQKLDIATAELDAVRREARASESESTALVDGLKALLERTDLRIIALRREAYEFKRDVIIGGENPRTGKISAEKILKHFDDQMRAKEALIDKLRLKNATLRAAQAKAEAALRQKEEVGDVLHYIDFHQLQIENKQYLAKIEEKNADLLRLKLTTGNTIQTLNALKARLGTLIKENSRLRKEITYRSQLLVKLRADNTDMAKKVDSSRKLGATLARVVRESEDLPTVMDYVQLKAVQAELQHELDSWARKLEIMELAASQTEAREKIAARAPVAGAPAAARAAHAPASRPEEVVAALQAASRASGGLAFSPLRTTAGSTAVSSLLGASMASKTRTLRPPSTESASAATGSAATRGAAPGLPPKGVAGFSGTIPRGKAGQPVPGTLRLGLTHKQSVDAALSASSVARPTASRSSTASAGRLK